MTCTFTMNSSFHICTLRIVLNTSKVVIKTEKLVVGQLEFYSRCLKPRLQLPAMFLRLPPLSLPVSLVSLFLSLLFSTFFFFLDDQWETNEQRTIKKKEPEGSLKSVPGVVCIWGSRKSQCGFQPQ